MIAPYVFVNAFIFFFCISLYVTVRVLKSAFDCFFIHQYNQSQILAQNVIPASKLITNLELTRWTTFVSCNLLIILPKTTIHFRMKMLNLSFDYHRSSLILRNWLLKPRKQSCLHCNWASIRSSWKALVLLRKLKKWTTWIVWKLLCCSRSVC